MIRHITNSYDSAIQIECITDPDEMARANAQREQFDRNWNWLRNHASEVYAEHRGRCICISGEELFVADTPEEAVRLAKEAHPDDNGRFLRYIPKQKTPRIYANQW